MSAPKPLLVRELAALDRSLRRRLDAAGFDERRFLELAATLAEGDAATRRRTRNTVAGDVRLPTPGEIPRATEAGTPEHARLTELGLAALAAGELAFCTLAGGMATRMGGVVKALSEAVPGHTFLSMRLRENATVSRHAGRPVPLWLMTSEATHAPLGHAVAGGPAHIACFAQDLGLRLTLEGTLFRDASGAASTYATGHGDLPDALRRSHLLDGFLAARGKYVWIANVDNLGATIDPAILGAFIDSGADVLGEVCRKQGDRGGIPVHAEGRLQIVEEFRLPAGFDPARVEVFNTNTMLVRAESLARAPLRWTYFEVEKQVDGRPAIQFERLIQELTAQLPSVFLEVPREGLASRFLPVKDHDELARRRAAIEAVARDRGMV